MKKKLPLLVTVVFFFIDQLIKNWVLKNLAPVGSVAVIPDFFNLTYVENRGAAFGIFQDKTMVLAVISGALLFVIAGALLLGKVKSYFLVWCICIGLAGGFGNLYDRVVRGFVTDYLDFSALFGFPVFNFADCLVVIATLLVLYDCLVLENRKSRESGTDCSAVRAGDEPDNG